MWQGRDRTRDPWIGSQTRVDTLPTELPGQEKQKGKIAL